nr:protein artichoke-like [Leptinotarsa decemlineata]
MIGFKKVILLLLLTNIWREVNSQERKCPSLDTILPCRCLVKDQDFQIWCSHSSLPNILEGLKSLGRYISDPIDELILENNFLPSLPGRSFAPLKVLRLMLRHNSLERVSTDWLAGLESSIMEIFIVEPQLSSVPESSLSLMKNLRAVTIQSKSMKRLPIFSGLPKLKYIHVESNSLLEISSANFKDNPSLEKLHIVSSPRLTRLEANLFDDLPKLDLINITNCGLNWLHPRAMRRLPSLVELSLVGNKFTDAGLVGRASRDLPQLEIIRLDHNQVQRLAEATFVDLPSVKKIHLSNNFIKEIEYGAFHRLPALRSLDLTRNMLRHFHPRSFLHPSESMVEELLIMYNDVSNIMELRSILDGLPRLVFLDMSYNRLRSIPFGALRGHPTLEQLNLGYNLLRGIDKEAFLLMPALRELGLKNNSLTDLLETPFWNLPSLKGLDLSKNIFRRLEPRFLANVGSLRRIDASHNEMSFLHPEVFQPTPFLEHINVSFNNLKNVHHVTFRHLTQLYELDMSHNFLKMLVTDLPRNIEHLHLHHNKISKISIQDLVLPALRLLDLSFNRIHSIPRGSLKGLVHLKRLYMSSNLLQTLEDSSFDGLNQLETLDLSRNRLVQIHPASMKALATLRHLNMADNEVSLLGPNLLTSSKNIQNVNVSRNKLSEIFPGTLDNIDNLEILDSSHNLLVQFPQALYGHKRLKNLNLSSNRIKTINATVLNSLTSLRELKLSRNFIKLLEENTFANLKQLKNIHLDDNEVEYVEPNSLKMLPALKSIKLDRNRITKLPNMAFNNLPSLQSIELQQNKLRNIEPNAFNLVPYLLLLNLSHNELKSFDHVGLTGLSSVELLDLSFNKISRLKRDNLKRLEWLVELRIDNNDICEVEEGVFDNMLRLRALSMENNRIMHIPEMAVQRLRSNVAKIDMKGNPLLCSCSMLWLQAWLKESSQEGPQCSDGSFLREMRLDPRDCPDTERSKKIRNECDSELLSGAGFSDRPNLYSTSQISFNSKYSFKNFSKNTLDGNSKGSSGNKNFLAPSPEDSDYFYDDYIDYPFNETIAASGNGKDKEQSTPSSLERFQMATKSTNDNTTGNTPTLYAAPKNPKPSIPPKVSHSPSTSGFTFFGLPIPSFNVSNLFGGNKRATSRSPAKMERKAAIVNQPTKEKRKSLLQTNNSPASLLPELQGGFLPMLPAYGGFKPIPDPNLAMQRAVINTGVRKVNVERTEVVSNESSFIQFANSTKSNNRGMKSQLVSDELTKTAFHLQNIANVKISNQTEKRVVLEQPINRTEKNVIAEQSVQRPVFSETTVPSVKKTTTTRVLPSSSQEVEIEIYDTTIYTPVTNEPGIIGTSLQLIDDTTQTTEEVSTGSKIRPIIPTDVGPEMKTEATPVENSTESRKVIKAGATPVENSTESRKVIKAGATLVENSTGSILSTFLVPAGQSVHVRPSAKSTITKVASPHNSASAPLLSKLGVADELDLPPEEKVKEEKEEEELIMASEEDVQRSGNDWYFENYNKNNIEPFVAKIVNTNRGDCRNVHSFWFVIVVMSYVVVN